MTSRGSPGLDTGADQVEPGRAFGGRAWPIALVVAVAIIGPGLFPGALFNLDLVLTPELDVPEGMWGLGPDLPRRLPLWVPIAALSPLIPATVVGKVLMVGAFVAAFTGAARLIRPVGQRWELMAGALYAFSPFLITRTAVGHFMVTIPFAVLPWVLPVLFRPGRRLDHTFLAALALGAAGHFGGSVALVIVALGIVLVDRTRWLKALMVTLAAQVPWLVPGVLVAMISSADPAGPSAFPTAADGLGDLLRLSAGGGFWNTYFQAGATDFVGVAAGTLLLVLAVIGTRELPVPLRTPLVALGIGGWLIAASSALPGLQTVFEGATGNPVGLIWREGHRLLTLHLVWLVPAAVLGARRLVHKIESRGPLSAPVGGLVGALPLAIAVTLAVPSLWGIGGQLEATPLPDTWVEARRIVREEPGTVLALPWHQYFNLQVGDGQVRRVLNPLPLYLGGDVLVSSDNELQPGVVEGTDPREDAALAIVERLRRGELGTAALAALGVRWIVSLERPDIDGYSALADAPGLIHRLDGADIDVYEVRSWRSNARTVTGGAADIDELMPGLASSTGDGRLVWFRAGAGGWMRGWTRASVTADGLLAVPPGAGPIWQLNTPVALLSQLATAVAAVVVSCRLGRQMHARSRRAKVDPRRACAPPR